MKTSTLAIPFALALTTSAVAATDLPLSPELSTAMEQARSVHAVATLVNENPNYAATLMADAAALGVASPSAVLVELINPRTDCERLYILTLAASEAAPPEADISAGQAFSAAGRAERACVLDSVARGAVDGLEVAGLPQEDVAAEAAEIAAALRLLSVDADELIGETIANATNFDTDTGETVLAAADSDIETADIQTEEFPAPPRTPFTLIGLPSESQNNPSPN